MKQMKNLLILSLLFLLSSCQYDDLEIWSKVNEIDKRVESLETIVSTMNSDISSIQTIVDALNQGKVITSVDQLADGYKLNFSGNTSVEIKNGIDGKNGKDAPIISVEEDEDGQYYWVKIIDGTQDWILDNDGNKIPVMGKDGAAGITPIIAIDANGFWTVDMGSGFTHLLDSTGAPIIAVGQNGEKGVDAPIIGVKADTDGIYYWTTTVADSTSWILNELGQKLAVSGNDGLMGKTPIIGVDSEGYWTVDTGNGATRILDADNQPVYAKGESGDSYFSSVTENDRYVILTLSNGSVFALQKYVNLSVSFRDGNNQKLKMNTSKDFAINAVNVDYLKILEVTTGWSVIIKSQALTITAPSTLTAANTNCTIVLLASDSKGNCKMSKLNISSYEYDIRTLTFEDTDYKATPYSLDYCSTTINTWSDLIDDPQYMGPLAYGDTQSAEYHWWDEGNTELMHSFPYNYDCYCYWGGGHVISHYNSSDFTAFGDFNNQLTVYKNGATTDMNTTGGGHNGSNNFAVHFGYIDGSEWNMTEFLPALTFADGIERIIDHMYVNNTCYALSCYIDGNSLTASIGEDDYVKLIATGYDEDNLKTGDCEFYLCNGPDNIVTDWTKWDLSSLGKVVSIEFNVTGSSDNGYGFSQPAYFAYDDVSVRF